MVITNRDRLLLLKLHAYGMMATNQVRKFVFSDIAVTTVLRRLRVLEKSILVKRVAGLSTTENLWALTEKGADLIGVELCKRHFAKNLLEHDYQLVALRLELEGNGIAHSWMPEHEIRSMVYKKYGIHGAKERLIPDGLMGARVGVQMVSVAIELELTLKNRDKLKETLRRYHDKRETFAVWYIVSTQTIMNQVHRIWHECGGRHASIKIFYSYYDDLMKNPLRAKLYSSEPPKEISEYFRFLPAQVSAQRVSTPVEKTVSGKIELTNENHGEMLKEAC